MTRRRQIEDEAPPQAERTEALHVKYRPRELADVRGQDAAVRSLESALRAKARPQVYLFTGPAGTGKTTLARIVAARFGCAGAAVREIDAASTSGIDDMRQVTEALRYNGFGESPNKAIILNECQGLSKQAWDSLLTTTEEPPAHVVFLFTSTNPEKVPKALLTRCVSYALRALPFDDVMDVLEDVREREGLETPGKILEEVAAACEGSVRMALTMLAKVQDARSVEEARDLLEAAGESAEVIDLCRLLARGDLTWKRMAEALQALPDGTQAETVRILVTNYFAKVALGARSDKEAGRALDVLEAFAHPCNPSDKMAPVLVAFGRVLL